MSWVSQELFGSEAAAAFALSAVFGLGGWGACIQQHAPLPVGWPK